MYAIKPILDEVKLKAPVADKAYYRYYRGSQRQRRRGNAQNSRKLVTPGNLKIRLSVAVLSLKNQLVLRSM